MYDLVSRIVERNIAGPNDVWGCTLEQINHIAADQGATRLPSTYVSMMRAIGGWAGQLYMWVDFHYPTIIGAKSRAVEILKEYGTGVELPSDALVFSLYEHVDQFQFFRTSEGDDPPVYLCDPDADPPIQAKYGRMSDYIVNLVEGWGKPVAP